MQELEQHKVHEPPPAPARPKPPANSDACVATLGNTTASVPLPFRRKPKRLDAFQLRYDNDRRWHVSITLLLRMTCHRSPLEANATLAAGGEQIFAAANIA
jgi:hypothetical protein